MMALRLMLLALFLAPAAIAGVSNVADDDSKTKHKLVHDDGQHTQKQATLSEIEEMRKEVCPTTACISWLARELSVIESLEPAVWRDR